MSPRYDKSPSANEMTILQIKIGWEKMYICTALGRMRRVNVIQEVLKGKNTPPTRKRWIIC